MWWSLIGTQARFGRSARFILSWIWQCSSLLTCKLQRSSGTCCSPSSRARAPTGLHDPFFASDSFSSWLQGSSVMMLLSQPENVVFLSAEPWPATIAHLDTAFSTVVVSKPWPVCSVSCTPNDACLPANIRPRRCFLYCVVPISALPNRQPSICSIWQWGPQCGNGCARVARDPSPKAVED
ncbi:hypothetical protein F4780DRAFT_220770 [Xylariomycetidae sp. FL0641]|nr:hypothetical protein F4780DRAFT_220770 [Xylariomycetidae sp. FL0641]